MDRPPAHTTASTVWGGPGIQERTVLAKESWRGTVVKDLRILGLVWKEAEAAAIERQD